MKALNTQNYGHYAVIVKSVQEAKKINKYIQAYILPIKNFSINYPNTFTIEDIKTIQGLGKEVFVMINKNIHNSELDQLKQILMELDTLNIRGIFFYDIALLTLKNKLHLKTDLVWSEEHLTTNWQTINFWYDLGVKYAYLSAELTKKEIDDISAHAKATLFVNVFGHLPMFTSRRHLVQNYLKYFNIKATNKNKKIFKENKSYPVIDQETGTTVYSNYILNAMGEHFNVKYLVFNSYLIDDMEKVFTNNDYSKETGFLYNETIYKVKSK